MASMVTRLGRGARLVPGLRRVAPSLAAIWREADRSPWQYTARRLGDRLQRDGVRAFPLTVAFAPDAPRPSHAAFGFCLRLGVRQVRPERADVVIAWQDATFRELSRDLPAGTINETCCDISKRRVAELQRAAFGYGSEPDGPTSEIVEKSDHNGRHDGEVRYAPSGRPGRVIQRLIDNRLGPDLVMDLRVTVMGPRIPTVIARYRPVWDRFGARSDEVLAALHAVDDVLTTSEQAALLRFCRLAGADYADLDVLRDGSGAIFVVDLNTTPMAAPDHLPAEQRDAYWAAVEPAWAALLQDHARSPERDPA